MPTYPRIPRGVDSFSVYRTVVFDMIQTQNIHVALPAPFTNGLAIGIHINGRFLESVHISRTTDFHFYPISIFVLTVILVGTSKQSFAMLRIVGALI